MRLEDYEQILCGFKVFHPHLLLMMDFDCPLAFCHKMGSTYEIFLGILVLVFVFRGRVYFFLLELVELFRLYLGALLCTLPF